MDSDLWETNLDNLTFSRSDMVNAYYGGEYESYFHRHASFSLEIGSYARTVYAQYRDYTYQDGSPIFQDLSLRIVPVEANLKLYPLGHRYTVSPFIGIGGGVYAWTYQQWGDFINFETNDHQRGIRRNPPVRLRPQWPLRPGLSASIRGWRSPWKGNTSTCGGGFPNISRDSSRWTWEDSPPMPASTSIFAKRLRRRPGLAPGLAGDHPDGLLPAPRAGASSRIPISHPSTRRPG